MLINLFTILLIVHTFILILLFPYDNGEVNKINHTLIYLIDMVFNMEVRIMSLNV